MKSFLAALQLLTRLPVPRVPMEAAARARAAGWFGVCGLIVGAILAAAERGLRPALPLLPRLVVVLILNAVLTGGLHLDGLADTADGWGGRDAASVLAIMRDSRIGSYGVLALLAVLGLQVSLLAALAPAALTRALLFAPGWGRASIVVSAAMSRPARPEGLGASFMASTGWKAALAALAPVVVSAAVWGGRGGLAAGAAGVVLAAVLAWGFRRKLGGQTGDTLGCVNELTETVAYGAFLVLGGAR